MTDDERPPEQEAIWRQLRSIEPPSDARRRVYGALEDRLARRRLRSAIGPVALGLAAVMAVLIWRAKDDPAAPTALVMSAASVSQGERSLSAGDRLGAGVVRVEDRLRLDLGGAEVEVVGPAALEVARRSVVLREGSVKIFGDVDVAGPACTAHVRGRGEVTLREATLVVTVFAGSAEITPPEVSCEVIDLSPTSPIETALREPAPPPSDPQLPSPAAVDPDPVVEGVVDPDPVVDPVIDGVVDRVVARPAVGASPRAPATGGATPPPPTPSALKQQSEAYWAAQRLRERDPAAALELLRELAQRWPRSPLRHEVDLAAVDILVQLGRVDDARAAARRFLRRFPTSARADHVRTIAGDPG